MESDANTGMHDWGVGDKEGVGWGGNEASMNSQMMYPDKDVVVVPPPALFIGALTPTGNNTHLRQGALTPTGNNTHLWQGALTPTGNNTHLWQGARQSEMNSGGVLPTFSFAYKYLFAVLLF